MYEFECQLCSRVHRVKRKRDIRKYCPGGCRNQPTEPAPEPPVPASAPAPKKEVVTENYDKSLSWEKGNGGLWNCPYAAHAGCKTRKCATCGWNPQVAEERRNRILNRKGVRM